MCKKIATPEDVLHYLTEVRGNVAQIVTEGTVAFYIGERPVIMTITPDTLTISCEVSKLSSEASTEELLHTSILMLKQNIATLPYAYALIVPEESDDSASIVLIDSVPLGDLCEEELGAALDSLRIALQAHEKAFN
jgi:hypothetical protein